MLQRLATNLAEDAPAVRRLELERLDQLLAAIWASAMTGDHQAINAALRIGERRAKLLALDGPEQAASADGRISFDVLREAIARGEAAAARFSSR